jgi:hypothetical protein
LNEIIDAGGVIAPAYPEKSYLVEIDSTQDIDRAKTMVNKLRRKGVVA